MHVRVQKKEEKSTIGATRTWIFAVQAGEGAVMTTGIIAALTLGTTGIIQNVNSVAARMEKNTTGVTRRMEVGNTAPLRHRWAWMSRTMWKLQFMESSVVVPVLKEDQDIISVIISEREVYLGLLLPEPQTHHPQCVLHG